MTNVCPLCQHDNPASARACQACGVGLVLFCPNCGTVNDVGRMRCLNCAASLRDEAAVEPAQPAPANALASAPTAAAANPAQPLPKDHAARKAAIRAAVRRLQLANAAPLAAPMGVAADVLVLDSDPATRDQLRKLLTMFGFTTYAAAGTAQASNLLETRWVAAAFLEVAFDGSDDGAGVELCHRIKQSTSRLTGRSPALFVVSLKPRPVDRVRASLAGCDAFLVKPVTRGGVALALQSHGVPLPSDPRGAARDGRGPADRQSGEPVTDEPSPP
jgi:CheY-like chemotaxis protein